MLLPELVAFGRFVGGLRRFLRHRLDADECRRRIVHNLQEREASFLRLIGQGVFARRDSAYRKLFAHAGVSFEDVCDLVARRGLEQALAILFDAGVYLRLDEFKGRRPIRRGSLVLEVEPHDFDNPLSAKHFASQSGGSRGSGTRIYIDLDASLMTPATSTSSWPRSACATGHSSCGARRPPTQRPSTSYCGRRSSGSP